MKKLKFSKILSLLLTLTLIFSNNFIIYADTNIDNLDLNSDGIVDAQDLDILAANYNLKSGDKNWESLYDLNGDNVIDIFDFVKMSKVIGQVIGVVSVSLSKSIDTLIVGGTDTLTATIAPTIATNKNVTWTSSNNAIATVDNGEITAVSAGSATITVNSVDGNKTASCAITVNNPVISVNSVSLSKSIDTLIVGGTDTLTATVAPTTATNKNVTWTSSNNAIATVDNGVITAVSAGTATITVISVDGSKTASCTVISNTSDSTDITSKFIDGKFKAAIYSLIGKNSPEAILYSDIKNITNLSLYSRNISSLSGIEYFTKLTSLTCNSNQLTTLDLSKNTALNSLYCYDNQLTALDLSKNTALNYLYCYDNQLKILDVSNSTSLIILYGDHNQLTTLDVSNNIALTGLYCNSNQLTTLDISKNTALINLSCNYNQLTTLYSIKDTWGVYDYRPQFTDSTYKTITNSLIITILCAIDDNTDITSKFADVNFKAKVYSLIGKDSSKAILYSDVKNINYLYLNSYSSKISSLNGIEYFTTLTSLSCYDNQLTNLDVSKNTALTYLNCNNNQLTNLDVSKNIVLNSLSCDNNQLTTLNVSNNKILTSLNCYRNQLTALDVSKNMALASLTCMYNKLTILDVSKNIVLTSVMCNFNKLINLDVSKNVALTSLSCGNNQLMTLDISKNSALTYLDCRSNQLMTLDVSNNSALSSLYCDNNKLITLDVSNNIALNYLYCYSNQLMTLYSIKDTWNTTFYRPQYIDSTHTATTSGLVITIVASNIISNNTDITSKFTDISFKTAVYSLIGKNSPNPILYSDVKSIKGLYLDSKNINSLAGVEYFTALTFLSCSTNELRILDLSKNRALTELYCYRNQLTTLYSIKDTWYPLYYRPQYTDTSHTTTTNSLTITIKN